MLKKLFAYNFAILIYGQKYYKYDLILLLLKIGLLCKIQIKKRK